MPSKISPGQITKIKTLAGQLWGDPQAPEYYEMLQGQAGVKSCKDLKGPKIDLVIGHLEKCLGIDRAKHNRQLGKIYRLWAQVSRAPEAERKKALRSFTKKRFGLAPPEWLGHKDLARIIEALKAMAGRR
jgi:hypothetical protein